MAASERRRRRPSRPLTPCSPPALLGCSVLGLCCGAWGASAFQPPPLPPSAPFLQQQQQPQQQQPQRGAAGPSPPAATAHHGPSSGERSAAKPAGAVLGQQRRRPAGAASALFSSFASSNDASASSSFGFELGELLASGAARAIPLGPSSYEGGATMWREIVLSGPPSSSRLQQQQQQQEHQRQQTRRPPAAPWGASKEESQVMQALILRAQADPGEMLRLLLGNPTGCNYVNVCTVLHRCGKASDRLSPEIRAIIAQQLLPVVEQVLPACQGRQLCNAAWALVRLGMPDPALFDAALGRLQAPAGPQGKPLLEGCIAGELAMAVWAAAAAGRAARHASLFERVAESVAERAAGLRPREIALITWAYATWLQQDPTAPTVEEEDGAGVGGRKWLVRPMVALLEATLHCAGQLQPRDIAMVAWAFGKLCPLDWNALGPHVDMLCATLASSALTSIRRFSARDLAELAVGVVAMQYDNANLMQLLACEACRKLPQFSHRELANILWAFGKLFRRPRRFVLAAAKEARARLPHFGPSELANVAWALTVLEVYDVGFFRAAFARAEAEQEGLGEGDLNQLYQAFLLLRLRAPEAVEGVMGPGLLRAMEGAWAAAKEREKRTTKRQAAVAKVLEGLSIKHVVEAEHDIDIWLPEHGVALEVDGPAHFLRNTGHPMGHTVMKRRLLELLGYRVVSVPHFEWDRIPYWSSMELKRYLQRKTQTTEVLHFSGMDYSALKEFPRRGKKTRFD